MIRLIAAAALLLSVAALPATACPYGEKKTDQSAQTSPGEDGTIILKPKASS